MRVRAWITALSAAILWAACSGAGPPQVPAVSTYEGFVIEQCAALRALQGVIENPDLNTYSPLMRSFTDAIERGDGAAATRDAAQLQALLEQGRAHARAGGAWEPAAATMTHFDRMLAAVQQLIEARLGAIETGAGPAERAGQAAFEAAGGVDAWYGWMKSANELVTTEHRPFPACPVDRSPGS